MASNLFFAVWLPFVWWPSKSRNFCTSLVTSSNFSSGVWRNDFIELFYFLIEGSEEGGSLEGESGMDTFCRASTFSLPENSLAGELPPGVGGVGGVVASGVGAFS